MAKTILLLCFLALVTVVQLQPVSKGKPVCSNCNQEAELLQETKLRPKRFLDFITKPIGNVLKAIFPGTEEQKPSSYSIGNGYENKNEVSISRSR